MSQTARSTDDILRTVLDANGIEAANQQQFLNPSYESISDTWKAFKGIESAVKRVKRAIECEERIVVWGDFDVDGLTSTSIMIRTLKYLGADPTWYIPDRKNESHGLNRKAVNEVCKQNDLMITVDCGITDIQEVKYAQHLGCDSIVTDHHNREDALPPAYSVLYPPIELETDFSGAGIAFKFAQALLADTDQNFAKTLLWLACLGTVVDCVAQSGENRVISHFGLQQLNDFTPNCIKALALESEMKRPIDKRQITWKLAPRVNSASRLGHTKLAAELLMCEENEIMRIRGLASQLEMVNAERKEVFETFYAKAESRVNEDTQSLVVVLDSVDDGDARGIQGLLAARLASNYEGRPAFVFTDVGDGYLSGSVRCPGYDFIKILTALQNEELVISGGGHSVVGGMSVYVENLEAIKHQIDKALKLSPIDENVKPIPLHINEVNEELYDSLSLLEPYGDGESPLFQIDAVLTGKALTFGKQKDHLKFAVTNEENDCKHEVLAWSQAKRIRDVGQRNKGVPVKILGRLAINSWSRERQLELDAKEIIVSNGANP